MEQRPRVTLCCVADKYHAPGERIVEFSSAKLRKGGLISISEMEDGRLAISIYRCDKGVVLLKHTNSPG